MDDKLKFYRSTLVQLTKGLIGYTPMHKLAEDADKVAKEIMQKVDEYEKSFNYQTQVNENSTITANYPNFFKSVNPDYLKTEPMRTIVDNGPQYPSDNKEELDYVCKLTQWDIDDLKTRLNRVYNTCKLIHEDKKHADNVSFKAMAANIEDVIDYFDNVNNVRTKSQGLQKARNNQKSYGTLGEHWKELMMLFDFKNKHDPYYEDAFNDVIKRYPMNTNSDWNELKIVDFDEAITICKIADSLGIEFIEDFVKACEKCEE